MKIAVLVKEVPDTWGDRRIDPNTKRVDRSGDLQVDEISEKAVEAALLVREKNAGSTITVLTMGPESSADAIRKSLAMGADNGIHIVDDRLAGSDAVQTSAVLAAALSPRGFDLVIAGDESTDGGTGAVPAMLAERLRFSGLTHLRTLVVADNTVSGERMGKDGVLAIRAALPAVVSVTEQIAEARFPGFKDALAARKKPVEKLSADDLELTGEFIGGDAAPSTVSSVAARPQRTRGTVVKDDGTGGAQLADFLIAQKLV